MHKMQCCRGRTPMWDKKYILQRWKTTNKNWICSGNWIQPTCQKYSYLDLKSRKHPCQQSLHVRLHFLHFGPLESKSCSSYGNSCRDTHWLGFSGGGGGLQNCPSIFPGGFGVTAVAILGQILSTGGESAATVCTHLMLWGSLLPRITLSHSVFPIAHRLCLFVAGVLLHSDGEITLTAAAEAPILIPQ